MSEQNPPPAPDSTSGPGGEPNDPAATSGAGGRVDAPSDTAGSSSTAAARGKDPLRGSRASGAWVFVVVLVVLLTLLAIFVLQNTQSVEISFLGWTGSAPLAAALLIATVAGLLIAVAAGSLRILQLRHRVRREKKRDSRG